MANHETREQQANRIVHEYATAYWRLHNLSANESDSAAWRHAKAEAETVLDTVLEEARRADVDLAHGQRPPGQP